MRIAVANWSDRHVGGAETYIGQILPALESRGCELAFWSEGTAPEGRPPIPLPSSTTRLEGSWQTGAQGLHAVRRWAPDLLFVHGLVDPACEDALLDVAPAVFFAHNYYGTCITGSKTRTLPTVAPCDRRFGAGCLAQFYPRRCGGLNPLTMWTEYARQSARWEHLPRYAAVLTFSAHMRREYRAHGVAEDRLHTVNPIVLAPREHVAPESRDARPQRRLVFAGRLDRLKGCLTLIEALPAVHAAIGLSLELVIAGAGPDEAECRAAAARLTAGRADLSIDVRGWMAAAPLRALVASADLLVMPSLWPEPLGLSGLEALACGTPVTAFAVGGIPEWLEDGVTGTLAPATPPTAAGLAAAIARALLSPAIATNAKACAATAPERWSVDAHVAQVQQVFSRVAARRAAREGQAS